ncbi:LexA regulated protein [Aeromonas simiae]|uniref:LexA regulated protein n=1 Tax=Aeromonas simiae TaxID=218936 RepID=A0A5J6WTR2_9GAMM|nr:LexA regulated protein [Aeromonas simiae]QFI54200.1 LexA regulated protein [Aeromonas simiae]
MAKQQTDRTTLDLFANDKRPGRPKTNPLPREAQLKINKRNQLKRDRERGLKRVELKVEAHLLERLNQLAECRNMSRAELIQSILKQQLDELAAEASSSR